MCATLRGMSEREPCCGVADALGRHAPDCIHALEIGLPRLAEGEEAIDSAEMEALTDDELAIEDPNEESGYDGPVAKEGEVSPNHPAHPQWHITSPAEIPGHTSGRPPNPDAGLYTGLWMSWTLDDSGYFDALIFGSELEALRYAVREGYKVVPLELGKPLREQADGG